MAQGNQVKNGKAFEYAIAKVYCEHINQQGVNAVLVRREGIMRALMKKKDKNSTGLPARRLTR